MQTNEMDNTEKSNFKEKIKILFLDERSFKKRFLIALFPCLLFSYTFVVFGPIEIFISNMAFFSFEFYVILVTVTTTVTFFNMEILHCGKSLPL